MKKVILLIALSLNTTSFVCHGEDFNPEKRLRLKIALLLEAPSITLKEDVLTKIIFEIKENKKINVVDVLPKDVKIVNYVKSRLNNKKVKFNTTRNRYNVSLVLKKNK